EKRGLPFLASRFAVSANLQDGLVRVGLGGKRLSGSLLRLRFRYSEPLALGSHLSGRRLSGLLLPTSGDRLSLSLGDQALSAFFLAQGPLHLGSRLSGD